jgi:hypothetical protein
MWERNKLEDPGMKFIDLENHFFPQDYIQYLRKRTVPPRETEEKDGLTMWYTEVLNSPRSFEMDNKMLDLGENRLKAMDAHGITMQALSLSPRGFSAFIQPRGRPGPAGSTTNGRGPSNSTRSGSWALPAWRLSPLKRRPTSWKGP